MGRGITTAMVAPTTKPASITAASAETYIFSEAMYRAVVTIHPDYTGALKIVWNDTTASATIWSGIGSAGDHVYSPEDIAPHKLSIYAEGTTATLGTSFNVYGIHE